MPKIGLLVAAAAVGLACVGAWLVSVTHARVEAVVDARIDPMRIMAEARELPVELVVERLSFD